MYVLNTNALIYFFIGIDRMADNFLSKSPKEISITTYHDTVLRHITT